MRLNCVDIELVPRNQRIVLQGGFLLLPEGIHGSIDFLQLSADGVGDDARPGFVGFAERNRIGMTWSAVATEGFIGAFGDVRPAHDNGHAGGAQCVGHAVGFGDHPRHGADPHQSDFLIQSVLHQLGIGHRLGVAINQQYFIAGWCQGLQQKHPKVRHEVLGHAVIGVIQQNFQRFSRSSPRQVAPDGDAASEGRIERANVGCVNFSTHESLVLFNLEQP